MSLRAALEQRVQRLWYAPRGLADALAGVLLWPTSLVVGLVAAGRRRRIAQGKARLRPAGRPKVVVVGNLVAGGAGKTPLIVALAQGLRERGWRPGVVARGYLSAHEAGAARRLPPDADAATYGDEPVLVARRTGVPVAIGRARAAALDTLLAGSDCDVVLSDDGLQHVGLERDVELAVFDARGAGNGRCLPAGPLREPLTGALLMDALVLNGAGARAPVVHSRVFRFEVVPVAVVTLDGARQWSPAGFATATRGETLDAVAAIGAPQRFFDTLAALSIDARRWPLPDHAALDAGWLRRLSGRWLIMTEKDAVKCVGFDDALRARCVVLRVEAVPDATLLDWLEARLRG